MKYRGHFIPMRPRIHPLSHWNACICTVLEELLKRFKENLLEEGDVMLAEDLCCGRDTIRQPLDNVSEILAALKKYNPKLPVS